MRVDYSVSGKVVPGRSRCNIEGSLRDLRLECDSDVVKDPTRYLEGVASVGS